jgi:omega-6 fatty acid desaturase (delta-12 desaturase)
MSFGAAVSLGTLALGSQPFLAGVLWPFAVWNWLMGWAIFEHHTHPRVPWYAEEAEWRAAEAQSRCTVHTVMPKVFDWAIHNIMQHTAHHLDVTIPLYRLGEAQAAVESASADLAIVEPWSLARFVRHMRICRLYDFERQCWLGFDGVPTAPSAQPSAGTSHFRGVGESR